MRGFKNRSDDVMNRAWARRRHSKSDRLVDTYGAMPRASIGVSSFLIRSSGRAGLAFAPSSGPSKKPLGQAGRRIRSSNEFRLRSPNVFVNVPFDDKYEPIFEALVFTISACGYRVRCALEDDDSGDNLLDKLVEIDPGMSALDPRSFTH
jgi:hypothetical protein